MMMMASSLFVTMLVALVNGDRDYAWRDYRGPTGQGWAIEAEHTPTKWSETENIVWRTPIPGKGWSTPVLADGVLWLTTATNEGHSLRAVSIDFTSGKIIHDVEVFAPAEPIKLNAKNSYASPSPVLDEDAVYVNYGTMGTACLDQKTGSIRWRNDEIRLDHKEGPGSSPILWNDLLILNCDGTDVEFVVALDKRSGKVVWKTDRPKPINENPDLCKAYSTPLIIPTPEGDELISTGAMQAIAYDAATGKERWTVKYDGFSNVPRPLFGDGLVYLCTGFMKPQIWAIRPDGKGDVTESHVAWKFERQVPANPSPLLIEKKIYMVSDRGVLTCLDSLTGKAVWTNRLGGNFSASPIYADGKIYFCSEEGLTSIVIPSDEFKKLAENQLDGAFMASPLAVGNSLVVRTEAALYRIGDGGEERTVEK